MPRQLIGIFGGTFDPIHIGHLHSAMDVRDALGLDRLFLVPCHVPPHRGEPAVPAEHRQAMVRLAVAGVAGIDCDDIELQRNAPSYSLDTLRAFRQRLGEDLALCLILGTDAFNGLHQWYAWRELFDLAHLVVIQRPGYSLQPDPEVANYIARRRIDKEQLRRAPAGGLVTLSLEPWPVSATDIRAALLRGDDVSRALPEVVAGYIYQHKLYGYAPE